MGIIGKHHRSDEGNPVCFIPTHIFHEKCCVGPLWRFAHLSIPVLLHPHSNLYVLLNTLPAILHSPLATNSGLG